MLHMLAEPVCLTMALVASTVLGRLAAQHQDAAGYVFVEDKHSTLGKVRRAG
jgi:hypothetical protein